MGRVVYATEHPTCLVGGCHKVEESKDLVGGVRRVGARGEQAGEGLTGGGGTEEEEEEEENGEREEEEEEETAWTERGHLG